MLAIKSVCLLSAKFAIDEDINVRWNFIYNLNIFELLILLHRARHIEMQALRSARGMISSSLVSNFRLQICSFKFPI